MFIHKHASHHTAEAIFPCWGFDLLVIVEANGEKLSPNLALLSPFEERVQAVEVDCCPFGGIGQD